MQKKNLRWLLFILIVLSFLLVDIQRTEAAAINYQDATTNTSPTISLIQPEQEISVEQGYPIEISWVDDDPDDNALISIAYDVNNIPEDDALFVWIDLDIEEDSDGIDDIQIWDTSSVIPGKYYIWLKISDGVNEPVYAATQFPINILEKGQNSAALIVVSPTPEPTIPQLVDKSVKVVQDEYFYFERVASPDGLSLEKEIIFGPAEAPVGITRDVASKTLVESETEGSLTLVVPAFNWSFGCSATSAAMIAGYYDRNGYSNMYAGPTNGGVMPLDNSSWPDWIDGSGATRHQCPLSATHQGLDSRTSKGHVDDYWVSYGTEGSHDPWYGSWSEHVYGDATADFMKTNQWDHAYENSDGATTFWFTSSGTPFYCNDIISYRYKDPYIINDGTVGLRHFYLSRGYSVTDCYSQRTDNVYSSGFTFEDYMDEIDTGYPVMIHLLGHTVVGVGYDEGTQTVILHDTWDYSNHTMTWGESYAGFAMRGVSIVHPALENPATSRFDFNGDGTSDIGIFRPSNNLFAVNNQFYQFYGKAGDIPVPADYDGDGTTDIAIYRDGMWAVNGLFYANYGKAGDIPIPADYNGDGKAELAIYRPSNSLWAIRDGAYQIYGIPGDIPVPSDYDGDGDIDIAIFRPSKGLWAVKDQFYQGYGKNGDVPVPADYDGDGKADLAICRPSNSLWAVKDQIYQIYGIPGDTPVPADYDGNGTTDLAIFRSSTGLWAVKDQFYQGFGISGDIPLIRTGLYFYH